VVIRHDARIGRRALDYIQAVHRGVLVWHTVAVGKIAGVTHTTRTRAEEIRIQGHDHVRPVKAIHGVHVFAEGEASAFAHAVPADRFILMPSGAGEFS
jgi:hypothetical protein